MPVAQPDSDHCHHIPAPHVLILGAGLGGLLLAQALKKQGISFEIFERDESLDFRFQGYAIFISEIIDKILEAVPDGLPPIDVVSHLYPLTMDPQVNFFFENRKFVGKAITDPKIVFPNRSRLRSWLANGLPIQWNKKAVGFHESEYGVRVRFEDGSDAAGDVLVGADGVRSIVRSQIFKSSARLQTVPQGIIVGKTTLNRDQFDRQMRLAHSAYSVHGDGFCLFVCLDYVSEDARTASYQWHITWPDDRIAQDPVNHWTTSASKQALLDYALEKTQTLDIRLTEIIRATRVDEVIQPPPQVRDLILETMPNTRITLLGDAAHPQAPFRGRGGVHAMIDAMKLAKVLSKSTPENLLRLLKEYQVEMLARGSQSVRESRVVEGDPSQILLWKHPINEVSW